MTAGPWLPMLVVAGAYLAMFAVVELLHRDRGLRAGLTRKVDHVLAGGIALALPALFDSPWPVMALAVPFVAFLVATLLMGRLDSVHAVPGASAGAFLYPMAVAATFVLASGDYVRYAIAILALALGDPTGEIVGTREGRHVYLVWGHVKTWEGSFAVLLATSLTTTVILVLAGSSPLAACQSGIFTGLIVALVEGALPWGIDNLGIPLAALGSLAAGSAASGGLALLSAATLLAVAMAASRSRRWLRRLATPGGAASNAP
jgi:phytol kinase